MHEKRALFGEVHHALTKHASTDHTRYAVGEPLLMAERNGPKEREHSTLARVRFEGVGFER